MTTTILLLLLPLWPIHATEPDPPFRVPRHAKRFVEIGRQSSLTNRKRNFKKHDRYTSI